MRKRNLFFILSTFVIVSCSLGSTTSSGNSINPDPSSWIVNDYGYAKYTVSPYSDTLAATAYNTPDGIAKFSEAHYKNAFYTLSTHYSPQDNILSCGIASAVIMLNAVYANINKQPPISKTGSWYIPEDKTIEGNFTWTEQNFFNDKVNGYLDQDVIYGKKKVDGKYVVGVTLDQLTEALKLQGLDASSVHADTATDIDIKAFRDLLKQSLAAPTTKYMLVNYNLNVMSALNGGHFSPIAAYDEISDTVLILDTWNAFVPWTWVKVYDLYKSMNTLDGDVYRGYILVNANMAT